MNKKIEALWHIINIYSRIEFNFLLFIFFVKLYGVLDGSVQNIYIYIYLSHIIRLILIRED